MTKINTQFKFSDNPTGSVGQTSTEQKLTEALAELEKYKEENAEWLSEEKLEELERLEVTMKAEAAALEAYGVASSGSTSGAGGAFKMPQNLEDGWNGLSGKDFAQAATDQAIIDSDPAKYGSYVSSINIPNNGKKNDPNKIAFQMTDNMEKIYAESKGRDIIVTVTYNDGTPKKSWIIKEGTMRDNPIVISALGLSHFVTIDTSHVYRVNNSGSSENAVGFLIWGTEHPDDIKGSQVDDYIAGMAGNDTIDGMAGNDSIWGDEYYEVAGSFDLNYGGNDDIKGGTGEDIVLAGGGVDTTYASDEGESVDEDENQFVDDVNNEAPDTSEVLGACTDWDAVENKDGVITLANTSTEGKGGSLELTMPEGYTMAYADKDVSGALVITFVGDNGSFKVRIEDFFDSFSSNPENAAVRLKFNGTSESDIIDFSRVELTSQVISISGGTGDDILLNAKYGLLADGIDVDNITKSTASSGKLTSIVATTGIFAPPSSEANPYADKDGKLDNTKYDGYHAEAKGDQIVITGDGSDKHGDTLKIAAPAGYEKFYITTDDSGNLCVVLVKPATTSSGEADTIVVKIDSSLKLNPTQILVGTPMPETSDGKQDYNFNTTITEISIGDPNATGMTDYSIDGGEGKDLIFTQKGTKMENDDGEDDVVNTNTKPKTTASKQASTTPKTDTPPTGSETK